MTAAKAPFTARTVARAALRWIEALMRLSAGLVSDEVFAETSAQFSEAELLNLTLVIVVINGWNRLVDGSVEDSTGSDARQPI
jgi:alkylhydroperoxidase family enzyme